MFNVLGYLLFVLAGVMLIGGLTAASVNKRSPKPAIFSAIGVFLAGLVLASTVIVPAGHRGILLQFGAVKGELGEGISLVAPVIQKVNVINVQTQRGDISASAASKDLQNVNAGVAINYHLSPTDVGTLYKQVGMDYDNKIIVPAVTESVKAIVSKYTASELITQREKVKIRLDESLSARLKAYNIIVEPNGVSLTNFEFSDDYNKAIETKQVAQQETEKQRYILKTEQLKAETAITAAKGEAEANRIKARALETKGGEKVLQREWITKWNGELPQVVTGSGSGLMLNLKDVKEEKQPQTGAQ